MNTTTDMKLSEAIRLGATLDTQGFGTIAYTSRGGTCALSAAAKAVGIPLRQGMLTPYEELEAKWPVLRSIVRHPVTKHTTVLTMAIYNLNDTYRWPRERIAGYVQTIEESQIIKQEEIHDQQVELIVK
jgi:hypothetical protein